MIDDEANPVRSVEPELRRTEDYDAMVKLGKESGLEIERLGVVTVGWGLYQGERMVGCACLMEKNGVYVLECLAVVGNLRGKGLGTRLVRKIEAEARKRGAAKLVALARSPEFFKKAGYRVARPEEIDYLTISSCSACPQFEKSCFPAVVVIDL